MYSNTKWVPTFILTIFLTAALPLAASSQRRIFIHSTQSLLPPDEARDLFNAGLKLYDESRFSDAESKMARPRVAVSASHHYKSPVEDEVAPLSHPRVPVESRAL